MTTARSSLALGLASSGCAIYFCAPPSGHRQGHWNRQARGVAALTVVPTRGGTQVPRHAAEVADRGRMLEAQPLGPKFRGLSWLKYYSNPSQK